MEVNFEEYYHRLLTNDLESLYITGGEPLLIPAHWKILEFLIDAGISNNISLLYNTNLTLIKYKDIDAINLWKKFKSVTLLVSIDATDEIFEYIRSGASWKTVKENLFKLMKFPFINVSISCTVSILNIWTLDKFVKFCYDNNIKFSLSLLHGPDYLALDVVPDSLKDQALTVIGQVRKYCDYVELDIIEKMITNNINQCLIDQTIRHILLLDNIRNEKLFQHLPFLAIAKERTLDNHEYQQ